MHCTERNRAIHYTVKPKLSRNPLIGRCDVFTLRRACGDDVWRSGPSGCFCQIALSNLVFYLFLTSSYLFITFFPRTLFRLKYPRLDLDRLRLGSGFRVWCLRSGRCGKEIGNDHQKPANCYDDIVLNETEKKCHRVYFWTYPLE